MSGGWGGGDDDATPDRDRAAANSLRLADYVGRIIDQAVAGHSPTITTSLVCELNRLAIAGEPGAGELRRADVEITFSGHSPPAWREVPRYLDAMCSTLEAMREGDEFEAAAYAMWRLNWIHPFGEGNGRTARALSHFVLCAGLGMRPPGDIELPERILWKKTRYYRALDAADAADLRGAPDVSEMRELLRELLRDQLEDALKGD
jgi:Fic family protein